MRLIDAHILMEDLQKGTANAIKPDFQKGLLEAQRLVISSPTVEITEEQAIDKLHETGWMPRHDKEMTKRPTGKWIETAKEYYEAVNERGGGVDAHTPYFVDDIACPKCLTMFSTIDNETERFNCCPNCGARMEAEND